MKNYLKKLLAGVAIIGLVTGPAFAFTETIDRIGLGTAAPVITSCGTTPSAVTGSDLAGSVTAGTGTPTACTITFSAAFSAVPRCAVFSNPQLAAFSWTISATAVVVTQTATSSNVISWICFGQ